MIEKQREIVIEKNCIYSIFGKLDENIKLIEKAFDVQIVNSGDIVKIIGSNSDNALQVLEKLVLLVNKKEDITLQTVNYLISCFDDKESFKNIEELADGVVCLTSSGKQVKPKTLGQKKYIKSIKQNTVAFGIGPAGTGKTYLAMAMAITAFRNEEVSRIILTRPAIEAGENLGFLPGDLQQKVDPYLRPLYDALFDIMGADSFNKNFEKGLIEVAPLAYMRGRTLDNAYIILDEAQNTTNEQMKMFLTRIGFNSKAIITGDTTQIDLPRGKQSGLIQASQILNNIEGIGISLLTSKDVVRHHLVQQIINAYDKHASNEERDSHKYFRNNNRNNNNIKGARTKRTHL